MDYTYVCKEFHDSCFDVNKSKNISKAFIRNFKLLSTPNNSII